MQWEGVVTDREGDLITARVVPYDHEGPELLADFSLKQIGVDAQVGEHLIITPDEVRVRVFPPWTQAEVDEIMKRARDRARRLGFFGD